MTLLDRFESFITTMDGAERIDELLQKRQLEGLKRADYLLQQRTIIVEQKVLKTDPADRPQKFVSRLVEQGRVLVYGTTSTRRIFESMPDGSKLQRAMFLNMTKGLENSVAVADKQTRDTRIIFNIPNAVGVLLFLNESAGSLYPDLIRYGLEHVFQKTSADGSFRHPHNNGVIVISESHQLTSAHGVGIPCFTATSPHGIYRDVVLDFSNALLRGWAAYNNLPFVSIGN